MAFIDSENQPPSSCNQNYRTDRDMNVFIGLCTGIVMDGVVNQVEAENLIEWLATKPHLHDRWPASVVFEKLNAMMADRVLSSSEESELIDVLMKVTGGRFYEETGEAMATALPYCDPVPEVVFKRQRFVLTGKFEFASRRKAKDILNAMECILQDDPSRTTDYLVIGSIGSRDWKFASFGRKIERAVELRDAGHPISIISEEALVTAINAQ